MDKSWFYYIAYHELILLPHGGKCPDLERVRVRSKSIESFSSCAWTNSVWNASSSLHFPNFTLNNFVQANEFFPPTTWGFNLDLINSLNFMSDKSCSRDQTGYTQPGQWILTSTNSEIIPCYIQRVIFHWNNRDVQDCFILNSIPCRDFTVQRSSRHATIWTADQLNRIVLVTFSISKNEIPLTLTLFSLVR
jgi:hypothetical protein